MYTCIEGGRGMERQREREIDGEMHMVPFYPLERKMHIVWVCN